MSSADASNENMSYNGNDIAEIIRAQEEDLKLHWHELSAYQLPDLEDVGFEEFIALSRGSRTGIHEQFFLHAAETYSFRRSKIYANALVLLARKELQAFLNHKYLPDLADYYDKWNCIVELYLQTIVAAHGSGYGFGKIILMVRSAIMREHRWLRKYSLRKMMPYDEGFLAPSRVQTRERTVRDECIAYLRDAMPKKYWIAIQYRYLEGYNCREYAQLFGVTRDNAQKRLTRAKKMAFGLLRDHYPA